MPKPIVLPPKWVLNSNIKMTSDVVCFVSFSQISDFGTVAFPGWRMSITICFPKRYIGQELLGLGSYCVVHDGNRSSDREEKPEFRFWGEGSWYWSTNLWLLHWATASAHIFYPETRSCWVGQAGILLSQPLEGWDYRQGPLCLSKQPQFEVFQLVEWWSFAHKWLIIFDLKEILWGRVVPQW